MGSFINPRFIGTIAKNARNMAMRSFKQKSTKVPNIIKPSLGAAQKKLIRSLTGQKPNIRPFKMRRIRPPIPGMKAPTIGTPVYSPTFGKVLTKKFNAYTVTRSDIISMTQMFQGRIAGKRASKPLETFLAGKYKQPFTMLSRYTTANQVGARSPLTNRGLNATTI